MQEKVRRRIWFPFLWPRGNKRSAAEATSLTEKIAWKWWKKAITSVDLTVFADQEVQVAIHIGHAHFGLHLRSLQGGVNLPRTVLLRHRLHLPQPAAHGSTVRRSDLPNGQIWSLDDLQPCKSFKPSLGFTLDDFYRFCFWYFLFVLLSLILFSLCLTMTANRRQNKQKTFSRIGCFFR